MKNKSHRLIKYTALFVILLSILYSFFWFKAANYLENKIVKEITNLNDQGFNVRYNVIRTSGFPLKLKVNLDNFLAQLPHPFNMSVILTGPLSAHASVFEPDKFFLEIDHPFYICANDQLESKLALLNVGRLQLEFPHSNKNSFILFLTDISHHSHDIATISLQGELIDKTQDLYRISLNYENLTIKNKQFENLLKLSSIKKLNLVMSLQYPLEQAKKLTDIKSLIQTLYDNESTINLDQLNVICEQFKISANGTIAFDDKLQPLIVLSAEISGVDYFLNLMASHKLIHKSLLPLVSSGLHSIAQPSDKDHQEMVHKVSVTLQNQELTVLNFLIAKFAAITWQDF